MGNSLESKLHEAVHLGQAEKALQMMEERRKKMRSKYLDPNEVYFDNPDGNTLLMSAAAGGFEDIYTELADMELKCGVKNGMKQNLLHVLCKRRAEWRVSDSYLQKRWRMLERTLSHQKCKPSIPQLLAEKDLEENTPLHLAARSGLKLCVELLVSHGSDVFDLNADGETACDLAVKSGHFDVADFLELKMVFATPIQQAEGEVPVPAHLLEQEEGPRGMSVAVLRCAKDTLLIETADLLGVPLFTAEALLKSQDWSKERLIEAWFSDMVEACEKAGIPIPDMNNEQPCDLSHMSLQPDRATFSPGQAEECSICCLGFTHRVVLICEHCFCPECWERYLTVKVENNDTQDIFCPAFGCFTRVPVDIIEKLVPREVARKFLQFDIRAYVELNPNICWCPEAGCDQAVGMETANDRVVPVDVPTEREAQTVQCGNGHLFCWKCLGEPHAPCSCEAWTTWKETVTEMLPKLDGRKDVTNDREKLDHLNQLWLVEYSKKCPKCKAHIEKNSGCNHMTCRKCKHDFCWVCLDPWGKHSAKTGGYFECNRETEINKVEDDRKKLTDVAKESVMLTQFHDSYVRHKHHSDRLKEELAFVSSCADKMDMLKQSAEAQLPQYGASANIIDVEFLQDALAELIKSRQVLKASFPYHYSIASNRSQEKRDLLKLVHELEEETEGLSRMVAKSHLCHRRHDIMRATHTVLCKRKLLLSDVPNLRKLPEDPSPQSSPQSFGAGHDLLLENLFQLMRQMAGTAELEEDDREAILRMRRTRLPFLEDSPDRPMRVPTRRFRPRRWSLTASDGSSDEEIEPRPPTPRPQMPRPPMQLPTSSDSPEVWDEFAPSLPPRLPVTLPRPNLSRRSDSPILPPLHPPSQPNGGERSHSASNLSDGNLPLADEVFIDESIFDAPSLDSNTLNDLSTTPSLHQFPTLPSLLQPLDGADSPAPLSLCPRSSSDGNGGSWHSGSPHVSRSNSSVSKQSDNVGIDVEDDDFEFQAALRRSMVEVEGRDNDDDNFERELQLVLEISRQEAMESGVLQLDDGDYCAGSTEA